MYKLEATTRIELVIEILQTSALPLGDVAIFDYMVFLVPWGGIEPPTRRFSVFCSTDWAIRANIKWRERRGSNSRPPAWQAGALTKLSYAPIYGGPNRTWTCDPLLVRQVLSQLSYRTLYGALRRNRTTDTKIFSLLLYRLSYQGKWRKNWDSNPDILRFCRFSRPVP